MASDKGVAIVVMGVSGAGKSTIGGMLAKSLNGCFLDADDYHPQSSKGRFASAILPEDSVAVYWIKIANFSNKTDKMKNGIPLTDDDRIPWLETLRDALRVHLVNGETVILGCSALKESYREIIRHTDVKYIRGSYKCSVKFVLLEVGAEVLGARLEKRAADGLHFMPATLLQSQLDLLQIEESEGILRVDASQDPRTTLKNIQTLIGS